MEATTTTKERRFRKGTADCGFIWFTGFIGAAIFYLQQSNGFWEGVVAILKAIVWPAFLVYKLLG